MANIQDSSLQQSVSISNAATTSNQKDRDLKKLNELSLDALTGVRGICSVVIVCGHYFTNFAPSNISKWPSIPIEYFQAVTLFFLLSGIALSYFYEDLPSWKERRDFWWKRFARIAPMYYVSLACSLPWFILYTQNWTDFSTILSFIFTPLFLQSLTMVGGDWCGPLWQISAFAFCYLSFPFLNGRLRRSTKFQLFLISLACYLIPLIILIVCIFMEWPLGVVHTWVPIRFPHFVIGLIVGLLLKEKQQKQKKQASTKQVKQTEANDQEKTSLQHQEKQPSDNTNNGNFVPASHKSILFAVSSDVVSFLMTCTFAICIILGYLYGPKAWWYYMLVAEFALVPLHCIWIYLLCTFRFEIQSMSVSFLSCRALSNLGDISYSLYVLHYPILYAYTNLKAWAIVPYQMRDREIKMGLDTLVEGTYFLETYEIAGVLGIVIVFAYFAHSYIEEPARRYLTANRSSKK